MNTRAAAVCILFLGALPVHAGENPPRQVATSQQPASGPAPQAATSPSAAAQTKIDPVKAADIQRLMDVMGMRAMLNETLNSMVTNVRPTLVHSLPPGPYRDKLVDLFFEKFRSKIDAQQFIDMGVAAYDKYFSDDDIKDLTQFYQTPIGKKSLAILPKLTVELQAQGMKLGQQAGRESMTEVLAEHPELAKAMQDAAQLASSPTQ
jgi:hypothetical protein